MMTPTRQAIGVPGAPSAALALTSVNVLVVDDSPQIRELLVNFFIRRKMTVTGVEDGRAGIQALERSGGRFDLVVTDLNMPGADGFAVLAEAKRANPDCAVVIVTGYATMDSAIQAVRVGAFDYLPKPFSLADVDRLIRRIAADRSWSDDKESGHTPPAPTVEQLTDRIKQLEARLASLGVHEPDGAPTLY